MSELKYVCIANECGRKFSTQDRLNAHIKIRHPELLNNQSSNNSSIVNSNNNEKNKNNEISKNQLGNIMKPVLKQKNTLPEKPNKLQPINKKILTHINEKNEQINPKMLLSKNNNKKNTEKNNKHQVINSIKSNEEIQEIKIPNIIEEKQNQLLSNLFSQINSLENYLDKDIEFHKEFKVPDVPDYDKMYDESDEEENIKNNDNIKKEKEKEKITTIITEEMLFNNKKNKDDDEMYKSLIEINLSKKNLYNFEDKKNISFEKLSNLLILNISYNNLSNIKDVQFFINLKELYINNNLITDLTFCEFLPQLLIFNAENNLINSITSLNTCTKLKILKLSNNKIEYLNSTLRVIKNLKNMTELSIEDNPFLSQLFSYREYFISNYKNIQIIDNEKITDEKRELANNFYKENNPLYKNSKRPISSKLRGNKKLFLATNINELDIINENINDDEDIFKDDDNDIFAKTQTCFEVKNNNLLNNIKEEKNDNKNNEKLRLEKIVNEQKEMILKLKMELDKSTKKNKEYESLIENYKKEITNENENNIKDNEKNNKILKELEMWKREYCKLLEESMGENYETKILNDELFNNNNNDKNLIEKKQYERPQTATIKNNISTEFEQLFEEINNVKNSKNIFDDVLNEESDDEEEENEDNENDKRNKK